MGHSPRCSSASLRSSLSTKRTLWPNSAKQAPATRPTYPDPTTAILIIGPQNPNEVCSLKKNENREQLKIFDVRTPAWDVNLGKSSSSQHSAGKTHQRL